MKDGSVKFEFNLMRNAIDSLEKSIDILAWNDEPNEARSLKLAILNVAQGIELLLKERLRRVHPSLVWENVDKYPSLSARTVGVETAIIRLTNIGGVSFTHEDVKLIRSLRNKRNAIEHFLWSITAIEAHTIIGTALGFAVFFSKKYLNYDFFGYSTKDDDTFSQLIAQHKHFANAYHRRQEETNFSSENIQVICDFCNGLGVDKDTGLCCLCGHINWIKNDLPF